MAASVRLIQLGRIFGEPPGRLTDDRARELIAARPEEFARALFLEAAASDDVTSVDDARLYLDARLTFFAALLRPPAAVRVRQAFDALLASWS